MADTVLTLEFANSSSHNLILDQRMWQTHPGFSEMTQEPGPELQAYDGNQGLQYTQTRGGFVLGGAVEMYCTWNNGQVRFGLKIKADEQVFTAGKSPYYYVMQDTNIWSEHIEWVHIHDAAVPYTWPTSVGFNIVATPSPSTSGLYIVTNIQDLTS